ncbi:MAG TPA: hypothetical protein VI566_13670 [Xanthomonadales bacterium]|nr:hypothetical protein [Xanthomonadales bacterium]
MKSPWPRRILTTTLVAAVLIALSASSLRHGYAALLALADLAHVDLPLAQNRPEALRSATSWRMDGRVQEADLYLPTDGPRAGMVLVPGAAAEGRNDPRLMEFATMLARSGFAVVVPDIQSLRRLEPSPESIGEIAGAFAFLRDEAGLEPGGWLGIGAFSVATGPAVLAALDPAIRGQVRFLFLVGGYHDMKRILTYLTTGYFELDGMPQHREPNAYGKWVYALSNAQRLPDPSDREALSILVQRKLNDPAAATDDVYAKLGPPGLAVYDFITNADAEKVPTLMQNLPPAVRADIDALNLAAVDLSELDAEVILVHGLDDDIIPYTESVSLAAALPEGQAHLYLLEGLHHVDRDISGMDIWRTWRALHLLLTPQIQ